MGGWVGGQAEYVLVPYADFNLMKFPTKTKQWRRSRISRCCPIFSRPDSMAP
jgi:threonine dehydrogenase-like Zn-dependent dehydrogenase